MREFNTLKDVVTHAKTLPAPKCGVWGEDCKLRNKFVEISSFKDSIKLFIFKSGGFNFSAECVLGNGNPIHNITIKR